MTVFRHRLQIIPKKAGELNPRLLSSLSGCLPDELLRRNLELNVDFVVLADLDPAEPGQVLPDLGVNSVIEPFSVVGAGASAGFSGGQFPVAPVHVPLIFTLCSVRHFLRRCVMAEIKLCATVSAVEQSAKQAAAICMNNSVRSVNRCTGPALHHLDAFLEGHVIDNP